ncbi:MAG: hypothetical protein KIS86_04595 [Devosia sp.]|nr:hypothetical protein [Devosia sp.]
MKPVNFLDAQVQLPRGDDGIWSLILQFDERQGLWSASDLNGAANMDDGTIRDFLRRLLKAGRIERAGDRPARPPSRNKVVLYRLVVRSLEAPRLRRDGTEYPEPATERMWRVMRMLKAFSATDIAEATPVKKATAERYLRELAACEESPLRSERSVGKGVRYFVAPAVGPKAPKVLRGHVVFDPNTRRLLGAVKTEEVLP